MPGAMLLVAANLLALLSLAYAFKGAKELLKLAAVACFGAVVFHFEAMPILALLPGILIFGALIWAFGKRGWYLLAVLAVLYAITFSGFGPRAISLSIFLGAFSGAISMRSASKRSADIVEIRRDLFQIASGIVIIALILAFGAEYAEWIVIALVIVGYTMINYSAGEGRGMLSRQIRRLEREGVQPGHGAIWLSIGTLLAFGFLAKENYIMLAVFALFFADPLATIFGRKLKRNVRLPYNKGKTVGGTLAFFVVLSALGYIAVGYYALVVSLVCALVESAPTRIDDNFSVPAALVTVLKILAL